VADRLAAQRHLQAVAVAGGSPAANAGSTTSLAHWMLALAAPHPGLEGG
jgi:hypothetical protein